MNLRWSGGVLVTVGDGGDGVLIFYDFNILFISR